MINERNPSQPNEPRSDRRQFFLRGLGKTLEGLLGAVQKASPIPLPDAAAGPLARPRSVLRPPGALPEGEFLRTCYRCGSCVDVCPVHAIQPFQDPAKPASDGPKTLEPQDDDMAGTPYVDPDLQACEFCSDMSCVKACPSGALAAPQGARTVRMGLARWIQGHCLRTTGARPTCQVCIEKCPVGLTTIHLNTRGQIAILCEQCVGCGVCQQVCQARPKAIVVQPL